MTPRRGTGTTAMDILMMTIGGLAAPTNSVAPVISGLAPVGSTLTCSTGTWTGSPTFAYQWKSNSTNVGTNQNTYVTVSGDNGHSITCVVTATNTQGSVPATSSNSVSVASLPVNTVAPVVTQPTGSPNYGSKLHCTTGTWTFSPSAYHYAWTDPDGNPLAQDPGDVADYPLSYDLGDYPGMLVKCTVTAHNAAGDSDPVDSNSYEVIAVAMHRVTEPTITGSAAIGSTLTAHLGTYSGGFPTAADTTAFFYGYQWHAANPNANDNTLETYTTEDGAEGSDRGYSVYCVVEVGNTYFGEDRDSNHIVVTGSPYNTDVPSLSCPGGFIVGNTATMAAGTWFVSPSASPTYSWYNDNGVIAGATGLTYTLQAADATLELWGRVTYNNGIGGDVYAESSSHTVSPYSPGSFAGVTGLSTDEWNEIAYNGLTGSNAKYCAVADTGANRVGIASGTGLSTTWSLVAASSAYTWMSCCFGTGTRAGIVIAVAAEGKIMKSTDNGATWADKTAPNTNNLTSVCYSESLDMFVAVATSGTNNRVTYSTDGGENWTAGSSIPQANWECVRFADGRFLACASSTGSTYQFMTSTDGTSWTGQTAPAAIPWKGVAFGTVAGTGYWVAVGNAGTTGTETAYSTDHGVTWTSVSATADQSWNSVDFYAGGETFLAVSGSGTSQRAMWSGDGGQSWTAINTGSIAGFQSVVRGRDNWLAVSNAGGTYAVASCT